LLERASHHGQGRVPDDLVAHRDADLPHLDAVALDDIDSAVLATVGHAGLIVGPRGPGVPEEGFDGPDGAIALVLLVGEVLVAPLALGSSALPSHIDATGTSHDPMRNERH